MLIRVPGPHDPRPTEITPQGVYLNRRAFMIGAAAAAAATVGGPGAPAEAALKPAVKGQPLAAARNQAVSVTDPPTPWDNATTRTTSTIRTDKSDRPITPTRSARP